MHFNVLDVLVRDHHSKKSILFLHPWLSMMNVANQGRLSRLAQLNVDQAASCIRKTSIICTIGWKV